MIHLTRFREAKENQGVYQMGYGQHVQADNKSDCSLVVILERKSSRILHRSSPAQSRHHTRRDLLPITGSAATPPHRDLGWGGVAANW